MADKLVVAVWRDRVLADRVCVLGPVAIFVGEREHPLVGIPARLVTVLSCSTDRWVSLEELMDSTWAGCPPASARAALHVHLGSVRRWLALGECGGLALAKSSGGYRIDLGAFELDYLLMLDLLEQGRACAASEPLEAIEILRCALSLPRGELHWPTGAECVAVAASRRIQSAQLSGEEDLVEAMLAAGSIRSAELEAMRLVEENPYRELRWAQLMRARYLDHRTPDALRTFGSARRMFIDELGVEPGPLLQGLERSILLHDVSAPALREQWVPVASSAPAVATPIIGREADLERCVEGLAGVGTVVIHGPPGVGKTRLAQETCRLVDVDRTVIWVDLQRYDDPTRALALSIGAPPDSSLHQLIRILSGPTALVVFDNAEHVCALVEALIPTLQSSLPELEVLVTSRVRPALGAAYLDLKRLPVPTTEGSDDGFEANASVRLLRSALAELAPAVELSRGEILQICDLAAGLPLILKLVAGNLRTLGANERIPLVEVTVGSQYAGIVMATLSLLPESRQHAFVSLCTIPGLFDVQLGAALVGLPVRDFLGTIVDLVDAGLVEVVTGPPARYQIHSHLREVVLRESLDDDLRRSVLDRLSDHAIAEARTLADSLRDGRSGEANELRAAGTITVAVEALDHLVDIGDAERALELSSRLDPTLYSLGWWTEKNELLDRALAIPGPPTLRRARALTMRARAGVLSGFDLGALTTAERIATDRSEDMLAAYATHLRGVALWWRGDCEGSLHASRSAADRFLAADRRLEELEARKFIGLALLTSGSVESGLREQQEVLAGLEQLGIAFGIAHSLAFLGHCHRHLGDDAAGEVDLRESLGICNRIGNRGTAIHVHLGLGDLAADRGDHDGAQRHASDALTLIERSRLNTYEPWAWTLAMRTAFDAGDVERAQGCARHALDALKHAPGGDAGRLSLELAAMAVRLDDPVCAARLVGAAQRHTEPREMPLASLVDLHRHSDIVAQIERALGDQVAFHVAAGRRCRVDEAAGGLVQSPNGHAG